MTKRFGGLWGWLLMTAAAVGVIAALVTGGNSGGVWFLFLLACPLMMLFMMGTMQRHPGADGSQHHMAVGDGPNLEA